MNKSGKMKHHRRKIQANKQQHGQVLLLTLVVLVGLLVGALLLFDLHNTIRGKIKVETAQQAAALAGANWQIEGLNLIGQLNLVKAADTMTYIKEQNYNDPEQKAAYISRMHALTELQSRTAFIVPLLGVMATQQTAKQNGMPNNNSTLKSYARRILPRHDHRDLAYDGYRWHPPYSRLVNAIVDDGCAVRVNAITSSMPEVWSGKIGFTFSGGLSRVLLSDAGLYNAIRLGDFCYWQLKELAKSGLQVKKTWLDDVDYINAPFFEESELLTLGVTRGRSLYPPDGYTLPDIGSYYLYDSTWYPSSYTEQSYNAHASNWRGGMWLRNDRLPGYQYEGAVCAVDNYVDMPRFNRTTIDRPSGAPLNLAGGDSSIVRTNREASVTQIGRSPNTNSSIMGVVAKPLGAFNDADQETDMPISTEVILPIFDRAALIPSTMPYNVGMLTSRPDDLKLFLIWLSHGNDIHNDDPPAGTQKYRDALLKLEDENYLKSIYNTEFGGVDGVTPRILFTDLYKFPHNPAGAGWLQQAWMGRVSERPYVWVDDLSKEPTEDANGNKHWPQKKKYLVEEDKVTTVTEPIIEPDGAIRTYYGNDRIGYQYFLTRNGRILTNEDIACGPARWKPGSGGFDPGTNTGPPRL